MKSKFDILIVEDEPVVSKAAAKILNYRDFRVDEVSDAETALQKFQRSEYKLLLVDLMLPAMSGFELIKRVKTKYLVPVIVITGYVTLENALKSFKIGAFDFIPKPFDIEELLGVVQRCLQFSESLKQGAQVFKKIEFHDSNRYCLGENSCAKLKRDGSAVITVGRAFPNIMGNVINIEMPETDEVILQGNACAKILTKEQFIHTVWAPLSGRVIQANQAVIENTKLIDSDPFNQGWLLCITPTNSENELLNLTRQKSRGSSGLS